MKKLKSKLFVDAAKDLYKNYLYNLARQTLHNPDTHKGKSYYSCDAIYQQIGKLLEDYSEGDPYRALYGEYFYPNLSNDDGFFPWWSRLENGEWDYESRFLALLLMAEITKDLNKQKK